MTEALKPSTTGARPMSATTIRAVILDLDGTLLDTAPDLVAAANAMRRDLGLEPLPFETLVTFVGKGSEVLVHRAVTGRLDGRLAPDALHAAHEHWWGHYAAGNGGAVREYPGMRRGLERMRAHGLRLACVTNKPGAFTGPLLEQTGLAGFFEFTLSGDSLPTRKPDPAPMLEACRRFGLAPAQVLAIGDSINDAQAARAAGLPVLAVPYGYNEGIDVRGLDVDAIVDSIDAAADWLGL